MKPVRRLAAPLALAAAALLLLGGEARAQGEDALVLPRGMVEVGAMGTFTHFDSRFGDPAPGLGSIFRAPFPASLFPTAVQGPAGAALDTLSTVFQRRGQAGYTRTAADLGLGTLNVELAADRRHAPLRVRVGLTSRLTLGVTVPFERRGTAVTGASLVDAALGRNVSGDSLARLFRNEAFGADTATLRRLAGTPYLPLRGTPAAEAFQAQYRAVTGDTTTLPFPISPLSTRGLDSLLVDANLGSLPFRSTRTPYGLGDVELSARYQFLNSLPARVQPLRGPSGFRASAEVGLRLPTGGGAALDSSVIQAAGESGHGGATAALFADAFVRGRFWISGYGRYSMRLARDVRRVLYDPERPFVASTDTVEVGRTPGARIELALTPRFRLTDEISLGARYGLFREGAVSYDEVALPSPELAFAGIESTEAYTAQLVGLGMSYSTFASWEAGRSRVPFDLSVMWERAITGSDQAPDLGRVTLSARLFLRAFNRPPRPDTAPAPAPADTTGTPDPRRPRPPTPSPLPAPPSEPTPAPPPASRRD